MKQKNFSDVRENLLSIRTNDDKEKTMSLNFYKNKLVWKDNNISNIADKNDELIMRRKIFNLSNRLNNGKKITSFNLSNEKVKTKNKMKFNFNSNDNNILLLMDKKEKKIPKNLIGNNNMNNFYIYNNYKNEISLKKKKKINDIKIISFFDNKKNNNINNIYPVNQINKNSNEKKQRTLSKNGNKNINYRKYLFNEKIDIFNIKNLKNMKNIIDNKNDIKKTIKINEMQKKGLFYLYNLQNSIYINNKKLKNTEKYPSFNTFNQTGNNSANITNVSKRDNSYSNKPIILFPNRFNEKYTTLNTNTNFYLKNEENILKNKMKLRKQNHKNKYLNIFTQIGFNDSGSKKIKNFNINLLTSKNLENVEKKFKLKLIKAMTNNNTEVTLDKENKENKENKNNKENKDNNIQKNIKNENTNTINNISLNDISEISKITTSEIKDSKYYMEKSLSLIKYIKEYYIQNKKYPETKINFYLYGRRIGQGAFGKVNLGLNVLTGRVVAIKSFKKTPIEKFKHRMKKIQYETELMKRFNHKNITKILEVFNDEEYMLIIMEYINGGNLFSFVKKRRKLSEKMSKFLFRQIILGIQHIHSKNVVHRDIKLENILIDFNNNVKICDFGIGKVLNSEDELLYDKCGTPMYMAPEIILSNDDNGYKGFPVDIWSSGITLYIMLSGNLPFNFKNKDNKKPCNSLNNNMKSKNNSYLQNQIINEKPKDIDNISEEAKNLLKGLLNKNPLKRLTCEEILNHPWLKNSTNFDSFNLFTKAEMTMMSQTYIDYRKGDIEDLKENFTLSNLKNDEIKLEEKNITSKSTILDPFNSCIDDDISLSENDSGIIENSFDDFKNKEIKLENDIMIFNNKVKEFNLNFEANNNQEVDNGMIIKTHTEISISSELSNNIISNIDKNNNKNNEKNKENDLFIDLNILNDMEKYGYDKDYVLYCIKNNVLCHALTVFYLLKNYKDIE